MKVLVVIAPERFRDEELYDPIKVFDEHGIDYDIASLKTGTCTGMIGGTAEAALTISEADAATYDGIVIIGGLGAQDFLWDDKALTQLVKAFFDTGKVVAAICLSPVVLARAGVLRGREATVFRSPASIYEMERGGAVLVDIPVVADLDLITANGPQAAKHFAEEIAEKLGC